VLEVDARLKEWCGLGSVMYGGAARTAFRMEDHVIESRWRIVRVIE
jgi:hypothetical protein